MNIPTLLTCVRRALTPAFVAVSLFTLALIPTTALRASTNQDTSTPGPASFKALYVLGDSLSDTGRTFSVIGFPPAPYYYQGRVSNGPVWVEYLSPQLGMKYNPLDNFSWAGSNTGRVNVFAGLPGMLDQLDELRAATKHRLDKHALYVVFGGANDFLRILANPAQAGALIFEAASNVARIVTELKAAGAVDIVVFDLPNIGLTPRAQAAGLVTAATGLSMFYNALLNSALNATGIDVIRVSAFDALNAFVAQPAAYGFTNVTSPGLYNPAAADSYLFWDDIHPTTRGHRHLANAAFAALKDARLVKETGTTK